MNSLSGKLFASVMALLLAVLPLQGVYASDFSDPCHSLSMPHQMHGEADAAMTMDMEHDCAQVVCDDCSAAGHCAACVTALVSDTATTLLLAPDLVTVAMKAGHPPHTSSILFRPPRA